MAKSRCDYIQLRNVQLPVPVYLQTDAWRRTNKPQPATFSVRISYPAALISLAAENDTVGHTLNYGTLYRSIESAIISSNKDAVSDENAGDPSIRPSHNRDIVDVALTISDAAHKVLWSEIGATERGQDDAIFLDSWFTEKKEEITVDLHLPKAILRAERGLFCTLVTRKRPTKEDSFMDFDLTVRIEGIRCACIIGVNPHEREDKQIVELALTFQQSRGKARMIPKEYQTMVSKVAESVDKTSYETVEALATHAAKIVLVEFPLDEVTVRVEKPSAMAFVAFSGLEITRAASFFGVSRQPV
ncbi:folic acid synthesis protein [Trichophyton mentagrophytes]|nr:folic acid synthesis protein [Trichophyton mentagrophytes]